MEPKHAVEDTHLNGSWVQRLWWLILVANLTMSGIN